VPFRSVGTKFIRVRPPLCLPQREHGYSRKAKKSRGIAAIGSVEVECHVFSTMDRVIPQGGLISFLLRSEGGPEGGDFGRYLSRIPRKDHKLKVGPMWFPTNGGVANRYKVETSSPYLAPTSSPSLLRPPLVMSHPEIVPLSLRPTHCGWAPGRAATQIMAPADLPPLTTRSCVPLPPRSRSVSFWHAFCPVAQEYSRPLLLRGVQCRG
jgi:hypothetical protein